MRETKTFKFQPKNELTLNYEGATGNESATRTSGICRSPEKEREKILECTKAPESNFNKHEKANF